MKYAGKFLLMLSLLGVSSSMLYAQKVPTSISSEEQVTEDSVTINKAQVHLKDQSVTVNGKTIGETVDVMISEGTIYVPARFVAQKLLSAYVSLEESGRVLRIRRQGTLVLIENHAKAADVEGEMMPLKHEVYEEDGRYIMSAEDLKKIFEVEVSYDKASGTVNIVGEDRRINDKPNANFYFLNKYYTEGQEIMAINTSRDPNVDEIIALKWSVAEEKAKTEAVTSDQLSKIFSNPKAGTYVVGLMIQDERGLWSDWCYKTINIKAK